MEIPIQGQIDLLIFVLAAIIVLIGVVVIQIIRFVLYNLEAIFKSLRKGRE